MPWHESQQEWWGLFLVGGLLFMLSARVRRLLLPELHELSLFLIAVTLILVSASDPGLPRVVRDEFAEAYSRAEVDDKYLWGPLAVAAWLVGLIFSLYHVFTSRPKGATQKALMLWFVAGTNMVAGGAAAAHELPDAHGVLVVFPAWNLISAMMLVLMWANDEIPMTSLSDDDAPVRQVVLGTLLLSFVFGAARFGFQVHSVGTFSICMGVATLCGRVLRLRRFSA